MRLGEDEEVVSSVIVLSQGGREAELSALAASFDLPISSEGILVNNGGTAVAPEGWAQVDSDHNLGVPGGRNLGAQHARGKYLIFLDDDAQSLRRDLVAATEQRFQSEADLGIIGFRIVTPGTTESQQRWTPAVGMGDTSQTRDVTTFVGGGHAVRRELFEDVGGYFAPLFYGLEETDLSWRAIDSGQRVSFDASIMLEHPDLDQSRHGDVASRTARNRVWIARRRLPVPLIPIYCGVWLALSGLRSRSGNELAGLLRGTWDGSTSSPGERHPMKWSTVWKMARLGRPPII